MTNTTQPGRVTRRPSEQNAERTYPDPISLERLARLDLSPTEALDVLQLVLVDPKEGEAQRSYEALRSAVWKLLTSRLYGEAMRDWQDVCRRGAALMRSHGAENQAEKTLTLAELALESARFGDVHQRVRVAARPQVRKLLHILSQHGGQAMRDVVLEEAGLGQANLSRILATLASIGFVERVTLGREVHLTLTSLGREALSRPPSTPTGAGGLSIEPSIEEDEESYEHSAAG